jgi:hypothetical protein
VTARALAGYVWASPNTALGLCLAALGVATGGGAAVVDGVVEVHGGVLRSLLRGAWLVPGGAAAVTLGHVVLGTSPEQLVETRAHERIHVRQYERWGPGFLPAYLTASVWAVLRGEDAYGGNWFEREAFRRQG